MTFSRALWFIVKLALLVSAAVWLANRPGTLSLTWFGYRIDLPPLGLAMLGVILGIIALWFIGHGVERILSVPGEIGAMRGAAREAKGYRMLTRGFAAAAAGDPREAKRLANSAQKLLAKGGEAPPITRLLSAQAAQLEGDDAAAQAHFLALSQTPETAILGLRGLAMNALKAGDESRALDLAQRALGASPNAQWAADVALRLQVKSGRYDGAESSLRALIRSGALGAREGQLRRAALLTEKARQALVADGHAIATDNALAAAREAVKIAGDFAPARFMLARLLTRQGKRKEAMRLIEQVWDSHPHEILGEAYLLAGENERPLERTQRLERLQRQNADHPETHRLLAEADLAADLWGEARRHLERLAEIERKAYGSPTQATCRSLARLEEQDRQDMAAARDWLDAAAMAPVDAAWTCRQCGQPSDAGPECGQWQFTCRNCQAIDSLDWRVPARAQSVHASAPALLPPESFAPAGPGRSHPAAPAAGSARANVMEIMDPEPPFAAAAAGSQGPRETGSGAAAIAKPAKDGGTALPSASVDAARLIN